MRKLIKANNSRKDSIQAYACSCNCYCACNNSSNRVTQAVKSSAARQTDVKNLNYK